MAGYTVTGRLVGTLCPRYSARTIEIGLSTESTALARNGEASF